MWAQHYQVTVSYGFDYVCDADYIYPLLTYPVIYGTYPYHSDIYASTCYGSQSIARNHMSSFLLYLSVRRAPGLLVFLYYFSATLAK